MASNDRERDAPFTYKGVTISGPAMSELADSVDRLADGMPYGSDARAAERVAELIVDDLIAVGAVLTNGEKIVSEVRDNDG